MIPIRFTSLLLGILLVILAVKDSIAHTHQEAASTADNYRFVVNNGYSAANQELSGDVDASNDKKWLKGRKMAVDNVLRKEMKEELVNKDASKISGKGKNASNKPFGQSQTGMDDKKSGNKLNPKTLYAVQRKRTDLPNSPQLNSHAFEATSTNDLSETVESEKLLQGAIETMNMVSMDYKDDPPRKPPINNAQPLNEENAEP
ncbi:uncharacterized protein LOC143878210 isoform X2 [Tasmannia lanceolata]|uniref:uncharacterized protein LOC143878210 isoform X2 n=1 Tax=Tasmannia lanceolata TaxID=3420 RepID=UPI0040636C48